METFQQLKARLVLEEQQPGFNRKLPRPLKQMIGWLENVICNTQVKQGVIGTRKVEGGGTVTPTMFAAKEKPAHICPFVRDSLDRNLFWFEESAHGRADIQAVERRLTQMVQEFINEAPAFDPQSVGGGAPSPTNLKTFLLVLPNFRVSGRPRTPDPAMDGIHANLKKTYVQAGLMLGQFYPTCPYPGVHSGGVWPSLTSPWPAFAARYMAKHDYLFVGDLMPYFLQYFPEHKPE